MALGPRSASARLCVHGDLTDVRLATRPRQRNGVLAQPDFERGPVAGWWFIAGCWARVRVRVASQPAGCDAGVGLRHGRRRGARGIERAGPPVGTQPSNRSRPAATPAASRGGTRYAALRKLDSVIEY